MSTSTTSSAHAPTRNYVWAYTPAPGDSVPGRGASDVTARFGGFPPEAVEFFVGLGRDNTREFWTSHSEIWQRSVRDPFRALTAELEEEFGTFHVFRPNRDTRFSKDKSPYKDHQGAVTEGEGGEMYYVALSAEGLFVASGMHRMAKDQLERYRVAVDEESSGVELERIVAALERRYEIGGRELTTAPRGYPRDHPRVRLLQHKGVTAGRHLGTPAWLATRRAKSRVVEVWRGATALDDWLARHVGPSELPPPE